MIDTHVKSTQALRNFGEKLNNASKKLDNDYTQMTNDMNRVCEGWIDKVNTEFRNEFNSKKQLVKRMAIAMQQYAGYLKLAADIIDEYDRQKSKIGH